MNAICQTCEKEFEVKPKYLFEDTKECYVHCVHCEKTRLVKITQK